MVGVSKRQQLRNEKALHDLIQNVPGNDRCADCQATNPAWASWNLGIFLCMRCAALHRKMGTHISKVKSLSMDSWTTEQVNNMKSHGNALSNKIYNPKNIKPPIPIDIDEADSAMERFIRQKYQFRSLEDGKPKPPSRNDPSHNAYSPEGSPPPLPPKSSRFLGLGLKTSVSASNLRRSHPEKPQSLSPRGERPGLGSPTKPSGLDAFNGTGSSARSDMDPAFDSKLAALRDMGFPDDKRNASVLRRLNGDLERTIDALVSLGEGSQPGSRSRTPLPKSPAATADSSSKAPASTNPFDRLDSRSPAQTNAKSNNPFDAQARSATPLEDSFQQLQVSSQPLFPNMTGGYPVRKFSAPAALSQQPLTPAGTSSFSQGPFTVSSQPTPSNYNPFFQSPPQPELCAGRTGTNEPANFLHTNPFFAQTTTQNMASSPYAQSYPSQEPVPSLPSNSPFAPLSPFQQQQPVQSSCNPFESSSASPNAQNGIYYFQQPQQLAQSCSQPFVHSSPSFIPPQQTARLDKARILALYNSPSSLSSIPEHQQQNQPPPPPSSQQPQQQQQPSLGVRSTPTLTSSFGSTPPNQQSSSFAPPQVTMNSAAVSAGAPAPGALRNPFMTASTHNTYPASAGPSGAQSGLGIGMGMSMKSPQGHNPFPRTHMSQQSIDINGFQEGRHSPDAFTSLSARYT